MRHTWRVEAPQHAVNHTFFMHEILAFSALHKAHKLPDQRAQYYAFGIHHQDLAIRGVREELQEVTAEEAPAIVATSTLLTLSVFASTGFELNYPEIMSSQGAIEGILNIFNLMQGMGNVLQLAQVHVLDSFLSPMQVQHFKLLSHNLTSRPRFRDPMEAIPSQPMLHELIYQLPLLTSFVDGSQLPYVEKKTYLEAIGHIKSALEISMPPRVDNRELRFLFFWPLYLQSDFLNFVRAKHSGALAVLMYYSTILFASQSRYWFMEGWGERLMQACLQELDQDWVPAVKWPASFVNHHPTFSLFTNLVQSRQILPSAPQALEATSNHSMPPQRRAVEVPHLQYGAHEGGAEASIVPYSQHSASSKSPQEQRSAGTTHIEQTGSERNTD